MAFVLNDVSHEQVSLVSPDMMLTEREKKHLVKSWAKYFAEYVFPKIDERPFEVLYSKKDSRPNTPVNVQIGALLIKDSLKKTMSRFDYKVYGGVPLLGANGLVLKTHGNSDAGSFYNTIIQAHDFSKRGVNDQIAQAFLTLQE